MKIKRTEQIRRKTRWIKAARLIFSALSAIILFAAVLATPYIFQSFRGTDRQWTRLANIGQTYGVVSALLSGLALLAIIASLLKSVNEGPPERLYIRPSTGNTNDQISTSKWPSAVKFGIGLAVCASLTYTAKSAMSGLGRRIGI